jgi:hypothetical protein
VCCVLTRLTPARARPEPEPDPRATARATTHQPVTNWPLKQANAALPPDLTLSNQNPPFAVLSLFTLILTLTLTLTLLHSPHHPSLFFSLTTSSVKTWDPLLRRTFPLLQSLRSSPRSIFPKESCSPTLATGEVDNGIRQRRTLDSWVIDQVST